VTGDRECIEGSLGEHDPASDVSAGRPAHRCVFLRNATCGEVVLGFELRCGFGLDRRDPASVNEPLTQALAVPAHVVLELEQVRRVRVGVRLLAVPG
jgi:hypothetical protein